MCRLLGLISSRKRSAFGPLVETDKSVWRQSFAQPRQKQLDGWGMGWYPGPLPRVFKSKGPLPHEKARLQRIAGRAQGHVALFHLRRASNPRGLSSSRLRGVRNTQPFREGRWMFAHNGSIPFPDQTARRLGPFQKKVKGLNDSEVLFWLILREIQRTGSVPSALKQARRILRRVFAGEAPGKGRTPHRGLNILLSDGNRLWAYAEAPAGFSSKAGGLCSPRWPYFQMAFLPSDDHVWVASEPLWSGPAWRRLRSGELLEIRRREDRVVWKKRALFKTAAIA
jgi:glutamine amidotransferase